MAEIGRSEVDAFYLHLAEGQAEIQRSSNESGRLVEDYQGLTHATVLIHGTTLTRQRLGQIKDAGAKLVWFRRTTCDCQTTPAAHTPQLGIPVGVGADWLPSSSASLL